VVSLERLSTEAVDELSLEALEHRHRYEVVREFCRDRRVLDLCCGVGYGSSIIGEDARSVVGVDLSEDAIDEARRAFGEQPGLSFEVGDAIGWLNDAARMAEVDVLLCFEGVEHIPGGEQLLDALVRAAGEGKTVIFSVPNSRRYEEDNAFHLTNFDREAVERWADRFATPAVIWEQWHAQGSFVGVEPATDAPTTSPLVAPTPSEARPAGWATHYLVLVNAAGAGERDASARMAWAVEPVNARWLEDLRRSNRDLWAANARLADTEANPRGTYAAAASSVLDRWARRAVVAEARVRELEAQVAQLGHQVGVAQYQATSYHELRGRKVVRIALGTAKQVRWVRDRVGV
jgi:SAM-dependent methyltransferase